jgi:predicted ABC-type exoprotein transport system permease subunit
MTFVYSYFLDLSFFNLFFRVFFQIYLYIYVLTFFCFAFVEVVLMVGKIKQISMKHAQARSNVRIFYAFFYLNICIFAKVICVYNMYVD